MVTLLKNDFTGQAVGPATVANSGNSGNPFSHLAVGGGTTFAYTNVSGNMVLDVGAGSGAGYPGWVTTGSDGRRAVLRRSFSTAGAPAAARTILDIRSNVDEAVALASIHLRTDHQLIVRIGNSTFIDASRWALPGAGTYWLELAVTGSSEPGAADAVAEYRVYDTDGTTLLHSWTSGATLTTSSSPPNWARFSGNTTATGVTVDRMDDLQALFTDNPTSWLGPLEATRLLPTPVVTVAGTTRPSTPGGSDGTVTVTWPKLADPDITNYTLHAAPGHNATTGFTLKGTINHAASGPTCIGTVTGLTAGDYTIGVRAEP